MLWLIALGVALASLIFYLTIVKQANYWKNKGIPHSKPIYVLGNFASNVFRIKSIENIVEDHYKKFPNQRYFGMYLFTLPILLIRDLELVKEITIKNFDVFPDHGRFIPLNAEPLFSKNLFTMRNEDGWPDMRATLSPAFTTSKMRVLFNLMDQCSNRFVDYYKQSIGQVSVELKDAFGRFANDVIATSAFGVTCDSLKDGDNDFYVMGKDLSNFSGVRTLRIFSYTICPLLCKLLKVRILNESVDKFFRNVISETLRIRRQQETIREDMIHLLMEAQKNREKEGNSNQQIHKKMSISDEDITAHALVFFLAGFGVTSSAMTFLAYELAINPDVQQKLYEEICTTLEENSGKLTYEALMSMKYLDSVLSESLRLHAPVQFIDRKSVKPYTIKPKDTSEKPLHLEKGTTIWIPVCSFHHNEEYFPNPMKFDPERFNEDNKHNIHPYTYLPFGSGPRICIGQRFAQMEVKLIMSQILQHFEIVPNTKTAIPLKPDKTSFNNLPKEGVWVSFKPRVLN